MIIKTIGKNRGNIFIWLALLVFSLIMPCAAQAADTLKVEVQPRNASNWRTATSGTSIIAVVTGAVDGRVWGGGGGHDPGLVGPSGVYTDDSSISAAAVHAGILGKGKTGLLKINILEGKDSYSGTEKNGVKPDNFGPYGGSYSLEKYIYEISTTTLADPGDFADWGDLKGTFNVSLTGVSNGSIWGTDTYTSDSLLALAAVHAGKLSVSGTDVVVPVTLFDGQSSYVGSTRYGVTSDSCGSYGASFKFGGTCAATIDERLLLFIPSCLYKIPLFETTSLWMELVYVFSFDGGLPLFKLTKYGINDDPPCGTAELTVADTDITIKLTDVKLPGTEDTVSFSLVLEDDDHLYFRVTGVVSKP